MYVDGQNIRQHIRAASGMVPVAPGSQVETEPPHARTREA